MSDVLRQVSLKIDLELVSEKSPNFRPPSWPPPPDWPVVVDEFGEVQSRWADSTWNLAAWRGAPSQLNFGDGHTCRAAPIDRQNADLLRLSIGWLIWGPRGYSNAGTILNRFGNLRPIFALCSKHGILASSLTRFSRVAEHLKDVIAPSKWDETIAVFHRLYEARNELGFVVFSPSLLKRLVEISPVHLTVQTAYIPPRIWEYQVLRLRECVDDFLAHELQIKKLFFHCLLGYLTNFGSFEAALAPRKTATDRSPFCASSSRIFGCIYLGPFADAVDHFGLTALFHKWRMHEGKGFSVSSLSRYFNLVTTSGLAYIANFTLQRKEEAARLRSSCLVWDHDEKLGAVPIICGETTKTDQNSDARWVTSPSVEPAVRALSLIANLRMAFDEKNPRIKPAPTDVADPYLYSSSTEPWGGGRPRKYNIRTPAEDMRDAMQRYPALFDPEKMRITDADLKVALRLTPNLPPKLFTVGLVWPLAWHQFRRTNVVNMAAAGVSEGTLQQQLKHLSRYMPLYYAQGYGRLVLNAEVEKAVVVALYESMGSQLQTLVSPRFVSPHSAAHKDSLVVRIIDAKDVKQLSEWASLGKVSFREHALGGCMKPGPCELGGYESVARCGGGDGREPCGHVLFDTHKKSRVEGDLANVIAEMQTLNRTHPRYAALVKERKALENYLETVACSA